jgi:hypothetical protein
LAQVNGKITCLALGGDNLGVGEHFDVGMQIVVQKSGRDGWARTAIPVI